MRSRRPLLAAASLVAVLALAGCGDDGDGNDTASDPTPTASPDTATSAPAESGACEYPEDGQQPATPVDAPPAEPSVSGEVPVLITTSSGDIPATLDADTTPCTVNSFVSLAGQGYFDDTPCHRLTTAESGIAVLQCGDPTGTGSGGPGYSFEDELSGSETYPAGTLAMANAGPNTNGSQFFMVYGDTPLPPSYTVFGKLDEAGLKVVEKIAENGTADGGPDGAPAKPVFITGVTFDD
jgi:peptidyl-prolyl cis-trans isomerase B (cyclophilin B)